MITQNYVAPTMGEAMRKVARELGEDAVIISTRELRAGRDGSRGFSVTASLDHSVRSSAPTRARSHAPVRRARLDTPARSPSVKTPAAVQENPPPPQSLVAVELEGRIRTLEAELMATRAANEQLMRDSELHSSLRTELGAIGRAVSRMGTDEESALLDPEIRELVECGLDLEIARVVSERAQGRADVDPRSGLDLMGELACSIPVAEPLWSGTGRRMVFLGTHGAGKTSTMARVAAEASCGQGLSVGLITVDAFRAGRAEQASCIAEDLGLPCMVAANREELEEALAAFEELDLVLVDTWGLNPWQADAREAIDRLVEGMGLEKHLVVSGTWRPSQLRELIAAQHGVDSLVVTKVDEARDLTVVLAATWNSGYAVSHVCTGPELLGDIVAADGARIAREIMTRVA